MKEPDGCNGQRWCLVSYALCIGASIPVGGEGGIDSAHPWASPCGRLAMLDVQIGNPADLSNPRFAQGPNPIALSKIKKNRRMAGSFLSGGEGGIRTLGTVQHRTPAFQASPFDRSGTSPNPGSTGREKCTGQRGLRIILFAFNGVNPTVDTVGVQKDNSQPPAGRVHRPAGKFFKVRP